jgi:hypothetical protein
MSILSTHYQRLNFSIVGMKYQMVVLQAVLMDMDRMGNHYMAKKVSSIKLLLLMVNCRLQALPIPTFMQHLRLTLVMMALKLQ